MKFITNTYFLIINLILIFRYSIKIVKGQISYDDQVPFVYYSQAIQLKKYGQNMPQQQILDYKQKNFKAIPQVIVGISFYNNIWNPDRVILFQLTAESVTESQCTIQLTFDNNSSYLYGISANVIVVDTSQFPYMKVINTQKIGIQFGSSYSFEETRNFSSDLSGSKNVNVVIRGWKSQTQTSSKKNFSLLVFATKIDDQQYKITFQTNQSSQQIIDVYYTIIEHVTDPPGLYKIVSQYDTTYKAPTQIGCFNLSSCDFRPEQLFEVSVNVGIMQINNLNSAYFFTSINQFDFKTTVSDTDPRLELTKFQFQADSIKYSYRIWDGAICNGSTSSFLFFKRKFCQNGQIMDINGNTCRSNCKIINPQNSQFCLDCSSGQYLLMDKQICQVQKSIGYSCSLIDQFYQCQNCNISNCQDCSQNSNSFTCEKCQDPYYLFQKSCQQNQPPNTYCDDNLKCQQCQDSQCLKCSDPSTNTQSQQCLTCFINEYIFSGKCYKKDNLPNNTYCDQVNLKCQKCRDPKCLRCTDPTLSTSKCLDCLDNQLLFNGECYSQNNPPNNTYCDSSTLRCYQCKEKTCLTCEDPVKSNQCLACSQNQILYEGKCYKKESPPNNTYCDWFIKFKCNSCSDPNCLKCDENDKCLSCQNNYFLYNQQCYTKNKLPINTYCDQQKFICQKCNDESCMTCNSPDQKPHICLSCQKEQPYLYQGKCFCGIGVFGLNCKQNCVSSCILCKNGHTCDRYSDERIYQNDECHFSCSKCFIINKKYGCQECSSNTRQLQKMIGNCECKPGYAEIGKAECQEENSQQPSNSLQSATDRIIQVTFVTYLPQLFINIHPYGDFFIFQMQSLGNLYFVNQNSTIVPYKSFGVLNFFNIYYKSSQAKDEDIKIVLGIKLKLIIDKQLSLNLLLLTITLVLFTILSLIVFIFKSKLYSAFIINNFLWNSQLKLIRISSNYFLLNVFQNIQNFNEMNLVSYTILGILTFIYLLNLVICFKKSRNTDSLCFKYLNDNLKTSSLFNRYFWLILEFKKIVNAICLSLFSFQIYLYLILSTSFLYGLAILIFKPHLNNLRDSIFLTISQLFYFSLSIFPMLISRLNDFSRICSLINLSNVIIITYSLFQYLVNLEYNIRRYIQYRRQKQNLLSSLKFNKPMVVDMALEINLDKLDDILDQSTRKASQYFKNKWPSKTKTISVEY